MARRAQVILLEHDALLAELARHLHLSLLLDDGVHLLLPHRRQRAHHPPSKVVAAARTVRGDRLRGNLRERPELAQHLLGHLLGAQTVRDHVRRGLQGGDGPLQLLDGLVGREWKHLHHVAARAPDVKVAVEAHAHGHGAVDLLGVLQVDRDVLRDLPRGDLDRTRERRLPRWVRPGDGEEALAHRGAHVELAIRPQRGIRVGVGHQALHLAGVVRDGDDLSDGPVALERHLRVLVVALEGAQEDGAEHAAAERGGGCGRRLVAAHRVGHHLGTDDGDDAHLLVS